MITQFEVPALLKQEIPSLCRRAYPSRESLVIFAAMNYFSDYTKLAVEARDFNRARKCFVLAERLYREGDRLVKLLIENSFIYSFSSFIPVRSMDRMMLKTIIPPVLYQLYMKQMIQGGAC